MSWYKYIPVFLLLLLGSASASESMGKPEIKLIGRADITVTTSAIRLSDIAEITSESIQESEGVIALGKIEIAESPAPGREITLSASEVLNKLKKAGVNIQRVGYALPRIMSIKRASRTIRASEIEATINNYLRESGNDDIELLGVKSKNPILVSPGVIELSVIQAERSRGERMNFTMIAADDDGERQTFTVNASVKEWIQVPVAKRPVFRGSIIDEGDIMRARMNANGLPRDFARRSEDIVGFEAKGNIGYGEVFRRQKLVVPPVIKTGSPVTLRYRTELLEATATGVSMDDGAVGESVRIKNDSSRKIISAIVKAAGLVEVKSE